MQKKLVPVVALMAVFSLAVCFIILGSISTDLIQALNIDAAQFGTLIMALFLTSCIVQLLIGPAVDKFGYKAVAILGFIVTAASIFLLASATTFNVAFVACMLLGVGAMSLNTVGNTLIPVVLFEGKDPARASNFGNAFFGMGYIAAPFLFTLFLQSLGMSYTVSLSVFGVLMIVFLLFALMAQYPQVPSGFDFGKAVSLLFRGPVLIAALALFCYIALETSMGSWIRRLMEEFFAKEMEPSEVSFWAGMVLTLFGAAMMAGRFISSAIKNLTAIAGTVIIGASVLSLVGILLMTMTTSSTLAIVSVIIVGLAFAPIFPTIVGLTFAKFDPSLYGSIFGIIFAIGLLGGTIVPNYIGKISAGGTVQDGLQIAAVMGGLLVVMAIVLALTSKKRV